MGNQFKQDKTDEGLDKITKPLAEQSEKAELPKNFFTLMFTEGVISKESATHLLPFVVFIAFLAMIYIGNRHFAENNIRDIDKLSKEVKELSWDFKTLKADLMLKSTQTEVAKVVDSLGLIEPDEPPKKIVIREGEFN
ncbi:MAG: FtsL-like putative cell division protein [Sphingobacterium thalpophilum]|jgi:hypothetical protein